MLLWTGQFVSQMGDRLAMVGLPWLVYEGTRSTLGTGLVFALYTLPYVLFGAFGGVAIDRFNKRWLMVAADVARAALIALVPVAAAWSTGLVFALAFLVATAGVLFEPAKLAILPDLVEESRLLRANSFISIAENVTEIVGYSVAGLVLAYIPVKSALNFDAATFVASALALSSMRYSHSHSVMRPAQVQSIVADVKEGIIFLRRHRGLLVNTIMVCASAAGVGAAYPLSFFLSVSVFNEGTKGFGLFAAITGAGFLGGSLVLAAMAERVRKGWAMTLGLLAMGLSLTAVAFTTAIWQACIAFAVFGLANAWALISIDTYLQSVVPEALRGRVFGVRFTLTQGVYALSVLAGGALLAFAGVDSLFVLAGVTISVPAILGVLARDIRNA